MSEVLLIVLGLAVGWYGHQAWTEATSEDRLDALRGYPPGKLKASLTPDSDLPPGVETTPTTREAYAEIAVLDLPQPRTPREV